MVNKGPFMEYLRGSIQQGSANAFTTEDISTPVSRIDNIAMLIHEITFWVEEMATSGTSEMEMSMNDREEDSMPKPDKLSTLGTAYAKVENILTTSGRVFFEAKVQVKFNPPLLYSKKKIVAHCDSDGFSSATDVNFTIGYTMEKVSQEAFLNALVED